MEPQTKRTLVATLLCVGVLIGWMKLAPIIMPPPQSAPQVDVGTESGSPPSEVATPLSESRPAEQVAATAPPASRGANGGSGVTGARFEAVNAESGESVTLGDDRQDNPRSGFSNPWEFEVQVDPRGASVRAMRLSRHRNHVALDRKNPDHDPYDLLKPVSGTSGTPIQSFATGRIRIDGVDVALADCVWSARKAADALSQSAILETIIKDRESDSAVLRLTKTFRVTQGSPHLDIELVAENLSGKPIKVLFTEQGPVGLVMDDARTDYRRVVAGLLDEDGRVVVGDHPMRADVAKQGERTLPLRPGEDQKLLWIALGNKYFVSIVTPLPADAGAKTSESLVGAAALAKLADSGATHDDLTFEYTLRPAGEAIAPGATARFAVQAYCGPKSKSVLMGTPEGDRRDYYLVTSADRTGCNIEAISTLMLWLLTGLHALVRNYGVAIIMLVIVVKVLLHPISRRGQINMMKMQKGMAHLRPKMEALQKQYKNDKQKYNEELMKLYREEGVNPAGQMLGCLPMLLQMPIWVALWTTLNTNVDMRHQPFFWWIRDLSSPDALVAFSATYRPWLLTWLTGPIASFNLLPVIMAATMYAQQKLSQKLTRPATPPPPRLDDEGRPLPDMMAQQQKMMNFMMLFFGLMFYSFPSGLNLYILSSNILSMGEQYLIRKEIRVKEERGDFEVVKPAQRTEPSRLERFMKSIQKRAEDARTRDARGPDRWAKRKSKKSPRP